MDLSMMVGYCGLDCKGCPIHKASLESNPEKRRQMRIQITRTMREEYGVDIPLDDVTDCDGCRANTGRLFSQCSKCEIRKCAVGREVDSCALCQDYPCSVLTNFFATDKSARTRLERIRRTI